VIGLPLAGSNAPGIGVERFNAVVRMTDMTAAPTEPPICWTMFVNVDPRATSWLLSDFSAEVMIGIIVPPMPRPITNSALHRNQYEVSAPNLRETENPIAIRPRPNGTVRPTGIRSAKVPAIGIMIIAPKPWGAMSRPAARVDSPRTWRK